MIVIRELDACAFADLSSAIERVRDPRPGVRLISDGFVDPGVHEILVADHVRRFDRLRPLVSRETWIINVRRRGRQVVAFERGAHLPRRVIEVARELDFGESDCGDLLDRAVEVLLELRADGVELDAERSD